MNGIAFNKIEHDVTQKPVPIFWHHALAAPTPSAPSRSTSNGKHHGPQHRRLRADRQLRERRPGGTRRLHRLDGASPLRFTGCLRVPPGNGRKRALADRTGRAGHRRLESLPRGNIGPRDALRHPRRYRAAHRCHGASRRPRRRRPLGPRRIGVGPHEDGDRAAARLRRHHALGQPTGRRSYRGRSGPGPVHIGHNRGSARREHEDGRRIHGRGGGRHALHLNLVPLLPTGPADRRCGSDHRTRDRGLADMGQVAPRRDGGRMDRNGVAFADHAESPHAFRNRRHRGGPDDIAAGATGRPA